MKEIGMLLGQRVIVRRWILAIVAGAVACAALATAPSGASARSAEEGSGVRTHAVGDADTSPRTPIPGFLLDRGRYVKFDAPGARLETAPTGINNRGQVVGAYIDDDADATYHGFLRDRRGRFRAVDIPGAKATVASRINDHGQIVGRYYESTPFRGPGGRPRGFLLDHGRLTRIDFPGAVFTQAVGVNNRGHVVGEYLDSAGTFHGFLWKRGRFTTIDFPGAAATSPVDVNDRGQILGLHFDADGAVHGFVLRDGKFTILDAPGAPYTFPRDINNRGQIAGFTLVDLDLTGARGFLLARGAKGPFTPIDVPGAPRNVVTGLNDRGQLVGSYENTDAATSPPLADMQAMDMGPPNPAPSVARAGSQPPTPMPSPLAGVNE
jgi:probable HAF family extracellular repeat protein